MLRSNTGPWPHLRRNLAASRRRQPSATPCMRRVTCVTGSIFGGSVPSIGGCLDFRRRPPAQLKLREGNTSSSLKEPPALLAVIHPDLRGPISRVNLKRMHAKAKRRKPQSRDSGRRTHWAQSTSKPLKTSSQHRCNWHTCAKATRHQAGVEARRRSGITRVISSPSQSQGPHCQRAHVSASTSHWTTQTPHDPSIIHRTCLYVCVSVCLCLWGLGTRSGTYGKFWVAGIRQLSPDAVCWHCRFALSLASVHVPVLA